MKRLILAVLFMCSLFVKAQELQNSFFKYVTTNTYILFEGDLLKGESDLQDFINKIGNNPIYKEEYSVQVNDGLNYKIGDIKSNSNNYSVMFIHSKKENNAGQIDFLILYKNKKNKLNSSVLNSYRNRWMELCNNHKVENLVTELYQKEAYYYNRGRLINGTPAITKEYGYMKSPNYSLQLSPKHITMVNDNIAYELGRCSGSYPLPYLLVWQKQDDGKWLILMDSNF